MTMKKNKLFFLLVASFLSLGSLTGCNVDAGGGQGGGDVNNSSSADNQGGNQGQGGNEGGQGGENQGGNEGGNEGGGGQGQGGNEGGGGQGQGGNEGGGGQGGNETITDWTDEQKTTMRDNLYGVVLPYISVPLVLRQDKSQLVFYGTELSMPAGTLSAYAQKFTEQDGWSGGDVSSLEGMSNGCIFSFNKAVDTKNGKRFVNATFMGFASTGSFDPNGRFTMYASDPYDYEYPQEMINGWLSQQFGTDCYIPAIQADYYNLYEEGTIYCFSSTNIEESVKALFLRAGFTIDANRDSEGFYVAHPSDGSYLARFKYDNDMKALILKAEETKGWNASLIKRFYTKYNQTPLEFPALDIDGASYKFEEDSANSTYASAGLYYAVCATYTISKRGLTNQPLEIYANKLREAGYSVTSFGEDNYSIFKTLSDGILYISSVRYDAQPMMGGNPQIVISFLAAGQAKQGILVNWPAQDIQRYLGADLQDSVPAYTGRQFGYQFDSGDDHALVSIYLDTPAASSIKNAYVGLLTENGYTLNGKKYVSRNDEIAISLGGPEGEGSYQMFQIAIEKIEHVQVTWPASQIAEAIRSNLSAIVTVTDSIPELDVSVATDCYVNKNYTDYHFEICIDGLASSKQAFETVFKNAGWTEDPYYYFDYQQYGVLVSPSSQMIAYFYTAGNDLVIAIKAYFAQSYWEWPARDISAYLTAWGVANDTVPAFDRASVIQIIEPGDDVKEFKVLIVTSNNDLAFTQYGGLLKSTGYEMDNELQGYVSTNKELLLKLTLDNTLNCLMLSVAFIGENPQPQQVYKVVGSFNSWSYETGIAFADATNPDEVATGNYVTQKKATFTVEEGTEFKLFDGTGNDGWLGFNSLEENNYFEKPEDSDNIRAKQAGSVDLYFKTYNEGDNRKPLAIVFTPDEVPPEPVEWPDEFISGILSGWGVEDEVPEIEDEAITSIKATNYEDDKCFELQLVGGAGLIDKYEELLEENYDYSEEKELWLPSSGKIGISLIVDEGDLIIRVALQEEEPEPEPWPEEAIEAIIGDEREIIDLSINNATYSVDRAMQGEFVYAVVTFTLDGKTASNAIEEIVGKMNDANYILVEKYENSYHYFSGDMEIMVMKIDDTHVVVYYMPGYEMPMEGYGFFVMNQDGTYESLVAEQVDNFGDYAQYKISEYEFKQGQMFALFNFGTHIDFYAVLENADEYVKWDDEIKGYVVLKDFTADVYIKLKYEDNKIYFAIQPQDVE